MELADIVDLTTYPIEDPEFRATLRQSYRRDGVLEMPGFVKENAISSIRIDGLANKDKVYAKAERHTVYLSPQDPAYGPEHPRNRLVTSSKGCLTDDQIAETSALRTLYKSDIFRAFLCDVLEEDALYEYADPLSSINLHFAEQGQELGWHFDNSAFAITLMIQPPEQGGSFEYVRDVRDADAGEMSFDAVGDILEGRTPINQLDAKAGTLVFFRGRNSIHRVAPNEGQQTRILAVLAYNTEPGISLSESARRTFYGRTG
ncbi:2OG-Fe(II) oxygenase [Ruegeria sp.]|uniref:HalD/BesD family halogenase n=1 Tax=Ruegeria sp. TaxID=1879320 RepID=UPI0023132806|nr:2OG-Fe(II) oxygenase [Ruegeria sp.]MDA7963440.1 2OG-Fe(II) oxygenase [Ruegeria sp.]